jgi:hypothetical protein
MKFLLTLLLLCGSLPLAHASVHTLLPFQDITQRDEDGNSLYSSVGINGNAIILATYVENGTRATLLRQGAGGRWAVSRVLSNVTLPDDELDVDVAMKNGIAAVRISTHRILIFERVNDDWTQTDALDNPNYTGGLAISGARILLGAAGCTDGADAYIFEKNATTGRWGIAGRIDTDFFGCDGANEVDLNSWTAMIRGPGRGVQSFRRNGSALNWEWRDEFNFPASTGDYPPPTGAMAVQGDIAVAPGNSYFRDDGTGHWDPAGRITPLDYWSGSGRGSRPVYRDGVLLNTDKPGYHPSYEWLYVFAPNAAGGFDHAAVLRTALTPADYDVSGRTVVVTSWSGNIQLPIVTQVFTLPSPLVGADAIAQDFETRDVSGITQEGNAGFALAGAGESMVLRSAAGGDAIAVLNGTNWRGYEYIEADVTPRAVASGDPWVGLALRYTDANNYYVASIHGSYQLRIARRVGGVLTTLAETTFPFRLSDRSYFRFLVIGKTLYAGVTGDESSTQLTAVDTTFGGGSVALLTSRARADFDNVLAEQTERFAFVNRQYDSGNSNGRDWSFSGGAWSDTPWVGLKQTNTAGSASAIIGVPVADQDLSAEIKLDSFGSSNPVSSFAMMARYVDARSYYSLSVRSSGQIQLRKTVGGVTTVLRAASFAPGAGYRTYRLRVIGRELHGYVDNELLLAANDGDIAEGAYGLSTYRTAISSSRFYASQP